jgi:ATP-binding cassette subfamily B multidrug efflux pump
MATLSRARAVVDKPGQGAAGAARRTALRRCGFGYGGSRKVLDGFSLTIRPGEKIGLVGRSGAGKSTVVNLLLRLYDLESGRILIDGQDIAGVTQESLRRQVGMVTQDTSLLHRSVRDNIVYGRPEAGDAEMLPCCRARRGARLRRRPERPQGPQGLRRARRRARRQAQRAASASASRSRA